VALNASDTQTYVSTALHSELIIPVVYLELSLGC
jgi:hypothetical protein